MRLLSVTTLNCCAWMTLLLSTPLIAATCGISSTGVAFGAYTPNQRTPVDSVGSVTVSCSKSALDSASVTVNYSVNFSSGSASGFSPREMTSGVNKLGYNLYQDISRSNVWGDATGGTSNASGSINLSQVMLPVVATHTVYSRIFASQNAVPGSYADSIVVTIEY